LYEGDGIGPDTRRCTMAWGIAMAALTLVGMLALLIATVQTEDAHYRPYVGEGPAHDPFPEADALRPHHEDEEMRKAA
jgi:hypothetical protein